MKCENEHRLERVTQAKRLITETVEIIDDVPVDLSRDTGDHVRANLLAAVALLERL